MKIDKTTEIVISCNDGMILIHTKTKGDKMVLLAKVSPFTGDVIACGEGNVLTLLHIDLCRTLYEIYKVRTKGN